MTDKIRVLQIVYSLDVEGSGGGLTRFVLALCRKLDKNKFDVIICGLWEMGNETERKHIQELNAEGIRTFTASEWKPLNPLNSLLQSYRSLVHFINDNDIHIIHSHSEFSDIIALLLKAYPGSGVITRTLHTGYRIEWRKRVFRRLILTSFLYPIFYNAEIGVAQHVVDNLNQRPMARLMGKKAILIHNGIELERFSRKQQLTQQSRLGLGIPQEAFVIGTVGRLREEKGYDILLDAAAKTMARVNQPVYYVIIGTGELGETLKNQTKRLQIENQVIFTGPRQDVEFLVSGMDLFVCSSLWEGLSTAVLEAMMCGVPVLATDIPGNRELIQPGVNGYLVPVGNAEALSSLMLEIIAAPKQQRNDLISAGRYTASEFSIDEIAKVHEQLYQRQLENKIKD